jgi:ribokinase
LHLKVVVFSLILSALPVPSSFFRYCDVLCPNQTELSLLSSLPSTTVEECEIAALEVMRMAKELGGSITTIIVTLGADGCLLIESDGKVVHHCPSPKLDGKVIDTVGAGDCFLGSVAYYLSKGIDMKDALGMGNLIAGMSVQGTGSQTSYPNRESLPVGLRL